MKENRQKHNMKNNSIPIPKKLIKLGRLEHFQHEEMLFNAEDEAKGFYYVQSGEIRVYKMDEQGKEVEVVRLGPGEFLGEAVAFVSPVFPAFAQAVKDASVLYFDKKNINKEMETNPDICRFFVDLLARKCVVLSNKIESLGLRTVRQRLIQYLLLNCSGDQRCQVDLKIKKRDLAKVLGTISETLSRSLKQMQEQGLIEVKGTSIFIKDCPALKTELIS
jgi:CRP-like cAMP-binding protein